MKNIYNDKKLLLNELKVQGITDPKVLDAIMKIPREDFIVKEFREYSYLNRPLPIGQDQTISQPFIVAYMTQTLGIQPTDKVLEIGTGCGYQTAILATLAYEVYSIEVLPELSKKAQLLLQSLGYKNIKFKIGNGKFGWKEHELYDKIIATAAPEELPTQLVDQLSPNGKMIIPIGPQNNQQLFLIIKNHQGDVESMPLMQVKFVPMV